MSTAIVSEQPQQIDDLNAERGKEYAPSPACQIHVQQNLFGKYNTATWMHDMYKESSCIRLNQVVIPGTHDSATDEMTRTCPYAKFHKHRMSQEIVYLWGKTQHHSIFAQLMDGIRYLDIRIEKNQGGWQTFHGLVSNNLLNVLDDIGNFASEHRREIIIVDFQHIIDFDFNEHVKLAEHCIKHPKLGQRLAGVHLEPFGTFQDFWTADKNVILFYNEGHNFFSHLFWQRNWVENPWPNTNKVGTVRSKLMMGIKERDSKKFHVSQLVLTPDLYSIISSVWSQISCLFSMTIPNVVSLINGGFLQELDMAAKEGSRMVNIIIVDFYEHSSFVERCLDINTANLNTERLRD